MAQFVPDTLRSLELSSSTASVSKCGLMIPSRIRLPTGPRDDRVMWTPRRVLPLAGRTRALSRPLYVCLQEGKALLPKGFVRIRFFGFLANRRRRTDLAQCQQLLAAPAEPPPRPSSGEPISAWLCPLCGGTMVVIERLTAQQVADRTAGRPGYVDTS